jgi:hypothetical protein
MAGEIDTGMPKADLKKLLRASSPDNPVRVAAAHHKDTKLAYLRVAKLGNAKALAADLKKDFPDAKLVTFGTAMAADLDKGPGLTEKQRTDSKIAVFRLEKPLSGLAKRLKSTLKGTTFGKVVILYEDGSSDAEITEEEEEQETQAQETTAAAPPPPPPPPAPPPQAAPTAPTLDAGALSKRLATLIPRVAAADATSKASLAKLAGDANTNLKGGNLAAAKVFIEELQSALDGPAAAASAATQDAQKAGAQGGGVAFAKSRLAWLAARKKLEESLEKLHGEIQTTYKDSPALSDIDTRFRTTVAPVLASLDEELADKLDDVANAADPAQRTKLITEAKATITRYETYVSSEKLLADLDDNPFVPLALRDTITKTLAVISATVR